MPIKKPARSIVAKDENVTGSAYPLNPGGTTLIPGQPYVPIMRTLPPGSLPHLSTINPDDIVILTNSEKTGYVTVQELLSANGLVQDMIDAAVNRALIKLK